MHADVYRSWKTGILQTSNERDDMTPDDRNHRRTERDRPTADGLNLTSWARRQAPHLDEVSNSNPAATLRRHNLVALTDDVEVARTVALDFERTADADSDTTMLVLGHAVDRESKHQADPEGVTSHAARRTIVGGLPGAVICAAIIGLGVWIVTESAPATAAAVIGGALFGFAVAAVWSYVIGTGQSSAYQQGFIDPDAADAVIVALHVDDPTLIEVARNAVADDDRVRLLEVDASGRPIA
jgi:hypothetical protein